MVTIRLWGAPIIEPAFYALPNVQQAAIWSHEEGHKAKRHLWIRLLYGFILPLKRADYSALLHAQEYEADAYAKARGHGTALANVLRRDPQPASFTHPADRDRIARLLA